MKERMEPAPGITELLVLAISRTLRAHPRLNARYAGDGLELQDQVNLGVAVATDDGLVVPSLKGVESMPLKELVPELKGLVRKARDGKLTPEELSGGTFTLSNLGMRGIDSFDAVINVPEAAILAVGRVQTVPEWVGGRVGGAPYNYGDPVRRPSGGGRRRRGAFSRRPAGGARGLGASTIIARRQRSRI